MKGSPGKFGAPGIDGKKETEEKLVTQECQDHREHPGLRECMMPASLRRVGWDLVDPREREVTK